jgi:hypothetical protein
MPDNEQVTGRAAPPYIAYQTVKTFVAPLKEHVIPNRIDKSVMTNLSGATQTQLMTALKFLKLIKDDGTPTDALKSLVESYNTENWSAEMKSILEAAFPAVFALPLPTISPSAFSDAFKQAYPAEGETLRKAITFFLNAARDSGVTLSPFLSKNSKPRSGLTKRRVRQNGRASNSVVGDGSNLNNNPPPPPPPPPARSVSDQLLAKFPDFDPSWTDELKTKWFAGYEKLLAMGEKK